VYIYKEYTHPAGGLFEALQLSNKIACHISPICIVTRDLAAVLSTPCSKHKATWGDDKATWGDDV